MDAVDPVHRRILEDPGFDHPLGAAAPLLRRLEEEHHIFRHLAPVAGHQLRQEQEHGHVSVVAAGVHLPRPLGDVVRLILLGDVQCVHVRPEGDGLLRLRGEEHRPHAGARQRLQPVRPAGLQALQHKPLGVNLLVPRLRDLVQPAAQRDAPLQQSKHFLAQLHPSLLPVRASLLGRTSALPGRLFIRQDTIRPGA